MNAVWGVRWTTPADGKTHFGDFESEQAARTFAALLRLAKAEVNDVWLIADEEHKTPSEGSSG